MGNCGSVVVGYFDVALEAFHMACTNSQIPSPYPLRTPSPFSSFLTHRHTHLSLSRVKREICKVNYKADFGVFAWVGVDKNKQWMCTGQMSGAAYTLCSPTQRTKVFGKGKHTEVSLSGYFSVKV